MTNCPECGAEVPLPGDGKGLVLSAEQVRQISEQVRAALRKQARPKPPEQDG